METLKPNYLIGSRAAILACACLIGPIATAAPKSAESLADSELSRRNVAIEEAQELLRKGDEAYTATRYADAVEAYAGARELIPDAPISAELRKAATDRYAQAAVEHARGLSREGDVAGAKATVDRVLAPGIAPDHPGAVAFRTQLDDPIRTNPALDKKHVADIDQVRRLLYTAEGAFDLGKFDQAKTTYESVLRIDSTNTAARRGLERVAATKSGYYKSAYDAARAEMLSQVDATWELQPSATDIEPTFDSPEDGSLNSELIPVKAKLDRIIIPKFSLDQASLEEALDFLRVKTAENDTLEIDPARRGVNFTVNLGAPDSAFATRVRKARIDLQLTQVPLSQVLKYITDQTQTSYLTDDFSVIISPLGSTSTELVTRNYRVPPDFISSISAGASAEGAAADPFAEAPAAAGLLARRLGAQEALTQQGVDFPQGASASYTPASNMLRVLNTEQNQEFIAQIIETMTSADPVMVSVNVTVVRVEQTNLEELGYDWLLDNFGFGGGAWIPGQSKYNLGGGTVGNGRPLDDVELASGALTRNPVTSGNRSGDFAITGNRIDSLITDPSGRQTQNSAPGVIAARGEISNATFAAVMRGLAQKKGVDLMTRPTVITRSGQSSSISVVREFIYPTEYEPPEIPQNTGFGGGTTPITPATPTAFESRDVGITLEVLPVVDEKKQFVNVTLNPVLTDFDGFVNYGSPINSPDAGLLGQTAEVTSNAILQPVFSVKKTSTTVDVADGATVVIGGLLQEQTQNVDDQTPILGSIPIVGRFFQSEAKQTIKTALIFLVSVDVIDPTGSRYRDR